MFADDRHKAIQAGAAHYESNKRRKELDHARKSIKANYEKLGRGKEHEEKTTWKPNRAPDVHNGPRHISDKDIADPQKNAAILSRAAAWAKSR